MGGWGGDCRKKNYWKIISRKRAVVENGVFIQSFGETKLDKTEFRNFKIHSEEVQLDLVGNGEP